MPLAKGTFEVKLNPLTAYAQSEDTTLGRRSLDKQFHGDLEAVSIGEMLSAGTAVKGSAGYVAIERINGTLQGKRGTFILQHSGTMNRGAPQLSVTVVPDSGTEELGGYLRPNGNPDRERFAFLRVGIHNSCRFMNQ